MGDVRYDYAELAELVGGIEVDTTNGGEAEFNGKPSDERTRELVLQFCQDAAFKALWERNPDRFDGDDSQYDWRIAGAAVRAGFTDDEIHALLVTNRLMHNPGDAKAQDDRYYALTIGKVRAGTPTPQAKAVEFEVITAKALCAHPDPPASDELLGGLIVRRQRTVVGADTGAGKTTMALAMLAAINRGREWLGFQGGGGRALVIDAEQGVKSIKRRLREAGLNESEDIEYIRVPDGLALDSNDLEAAGVEERISEGDYAVVLADPLYKLHRGDSNAEREAVDLMRRFDGWRERYGFALVLPVHCRKPQAGAKFTMHEFFGSSAYLRGAEVVLGLQRVRDGYSRLHFFKDRDGDLPVGNAWGLLFSRDEGYRRDPNDETPKQSARQVIAELVAQQPGISTEQLAVASGYAKRTVTKALQEIGASGERPGRNAETIWSLDESE
jgi:hypothetical protein